MFCLTHLSTPSLEAHCHAGSYSIALQKANGKLLPTGWWHLLQAGKKNDRANFYLIGIHPEYQKRGVTSIIFKDTEVNRLYDPKRKAIVYLAISRRIVSGSPKNSISTVVTP